VRPAAPLLATKCAILCVKFGSHVEVKLELLMLVTGPAIVLLSWYFTVHRFALSGNAVRHLPERRRNRGQLCSRPVTG
jgi:hypothetical protein